MGRIGRAEDERQDGCSGMSAICQAIPEGIRSLCGRAGVFLLMRRLLLSYVCHRDDEGGEVSPASVYRQDKEGSRIGLVGKA